jgi:amidase
MPDDLLGLRSQADALAAGTVSARELVATALDRIQATQSTLNAFRRVRVEPALAAADDADRLLSAGVRLPLLGVPIAIKDDTDLAGEPTAFGAQGDFPPRPHDSEMVRRLKSAGAIIVGKTNTPEFGQWPFTEGPAFGITRNPWNLDHTPGGSSGGAAAAVSAGLVPAAVGSDGAGSVRIPAAWTNLVGIKPQRGRISSAPVSEQFNGLTTFGTLGLNVADAALLLDVLAGSAPVDRDRPPAPDEPFSLAARHAPHRLRIGLSMRVPYSGMPARLDPMVRAAVERLGGVLSDLGHDVFVADPAYGLLGITFLPRSLEAIDDWTHRVPDPELLDVRTRANARTGRMLRPLLLGARAAEPFSRWQIGRIFRNVDVILAPTTAVPPPRVGELNRGTNWETDQAIIAACPFTWPWNVLGWPSINIPAGLTPAGLPMGAQLMGPANSESLLISVAAQLERAERWFERRPGQRADSSSAI